MAIKDKRLEFSADQVQTTAAAHASTNTIDLGSAQDWIGPGRTVWWVVQVKVAPDAVSANETYVAELETDDTDAFSSATKIASITIPRGTAVGTQYVVGFPYSNEQYLRNLVTMGGTTPSMTWDAYLTDQEPRSWRALPAQM